MFCNCNDKCDKNNNTNSDLLDKIELNTVNINTLNTKINNNTSSINNINSKISTLFNNFYFKRLFRHYMNRNRFNGVNSAEYSQIQGMTADSNYIYCAFMPYLWDVNISADMKNNLKIGKYDYDGNLITSTIVTGGGHANSLTIDNNGLIYIAVCTLYNQNSISTTTQSDSVIVLNSDLSLNRTINLGYTNIKSVVFDKTLNKFVVRVNADTLKIYDSDFIYEKTTSIDLSGYTATPQGGCAENGYFYFLSGQPYTILQLDYNNGDIVSINNIQKSNYPLGEIEDIEYVNGEFLMSTNVSFAQATNYFVFQIFKTVENGRNTPINNNTGEQQQDTTLSNKYVYVDINSNTNNPNGSISYPFQQINECIAFCRHNNSNAIVKVVSTGDYQPIFVGNNNFISIEGDTSVDVSQIKICGIVVENCGKLLLNNIGVDTYYYYNSAYGGNYIRLGGYVKMKNCSIYNRNSSLTGFSYYVVDGGTIELNSGLTFNNSCVVNIGNGGHLKTLKTNYQTKPTYDGYFIKSHINADIDRNMKITNTYVSGAYPYITNLSINLETHSYNWRAVQLELYVGSYGSVTLTVPIKTAMNYGLLYVGDTHVTITAELYNTNQIQLKYFNGSGTLLSNIQIQNIKLIDY